MNMFKNLERLPATIRKDVVWYFKEMLNLHGDNIISIFIYGSVASGDFIQGFSDINSGVIFKNLEFEQLKESLNLARKGINAKIAAPLMLTQEYIKSSLDTFPLEFLEMKEYHILLYGEDIFDGLTIDSKNIRFVCEEQIKGRLIRIRQAYLEIGVNSRAVAALMKRSLNSLFSVFRGLLRLKGISPPPKRQDVINMMADIFGLDSIFTDILNDVRCGKKSKLKEPEYLLKKYMRQLHLLAETIDKL